MAGEHLIKLREFYIQIGQMQIRELQPRGIMPDAEKGTFFKSRGPMLQQICADQPDLHIISIVNYTVFNRYRPDAQSFYLGEGDKNPDLELYLETPTRDDYIFVLEEVLKIPEAERTNEERFGIHMIRAAISGVNVLEAKNILSLAKEFRKMPAVKN